MSDSVAETLTAIRNAARLNRPFVELRAAKLRIAILGALKRAGYIWEYEVQNRDGFLFVRVALKYSSFGDSAIRSIVSVSKPGNRVYSGVRGLRSVVQGLGVSLLSTSSGVLTDCEARVQNIGGEVICDVF